MIEARQAIYGGWPIPNRLNPETWPCSDFPRTITLARPHTYEKGKNVIPLSVLQDCACHVPSSIFLELRFTEEGSKCRTNSRWLNLSLEFVTLLVFPQLPPAGPLSPNSHVTAQVLLCKCDTGNSTLHIQLLVFRRMRLHVASVAWMPSGNTSSPIADARTLVTLETLVVQ